MRGRKSLSGTMSADQAPPRKGLARREAFLEAARQVFLEQGYDAASMAEIVERAGGSLATLYAQFGDKRGLFLSMLETRMRALSTQMEMDLSNEASTAEGLTRMGQHFASICLRPEAVEMYRLILTLAPKWPDIASDFMRRSQDSIIATLEHYLIERSKAGDIVIEDATHAANMFLEMVRAGFLTRSLLDISYRAEQAEIERAVGVAVSVFLRGVTVPAPAPPLARKRAKPA